MIKPKDIKWLVETFKPTDFSVGTRIGDGRLALTSPSETMFVLDDIVEGKIEDYIPQRFEKEIYPLFLEAVIEAVNRKYREEDDFMLTIQRDCGYITVLSDDGCYDCFDITTEPIRGKEEALMILMIHMGWIEDEE